MSDTYHAIESTKTSIAAAGRNPAVTIGVIDSAGSPSRYSSADRRNFEVGIEKLAIKREQQWAKKGGVPSLVIYHLDYERISSGQVEQVEVFKTNGSAIPYMDAAEHAGVLYRLADGTFEFESW